MRKYILTAAILVLGLSVFICAQAKGPNQPVLEEKQEEERSRAFLGVYMSDINREIMEDKDYPHEMGVLVIEVIEGSPAEESNLMQGDIIYTFDGEPVDDSEDLARMVGGRDPGDRVKIIFFREGDRKRVDVELAERKKESYTLEYDWQEYADKMGEMGKKIGRSVGSMFDRYLSGKRLDGLELSELDEDLAEYFGVDEDEGILVTGVREDSPAGAIGIKSGDIVITINEEEIGSLEEYRDALEDSKGEVTIKVIRRGNKIEFLLKPEDFDESRIFLVPDRNIYRLEVPLKKRDIVIKKRDKEMEKKFERLYSEEMFDERECMILKEKAMEEVEETLEKLEKKLKKLEERLKEVEED